VRLWAKEQLDGAAIQPEQKPANTASVSVNNSSSPWKRGTNHQLAKFMVSGEWNVLVMVILVRIHNPV